MDKLLEIKIGGGDVHSGWVPLSAFAMVRDLLDAIAEQGPDEELWRSIEPQIEVVGAGSTVLAIHTRFVRKLRPQVRSFRERAKRHALMPRARGWVKKYVGSPSTSWSYVDMVEIPSKQEKKPLPEKDRVFRFDARYKERLLVNQAEPIHGFDEVYATVVRAGGETPTVTLAFLDGRSGTFEIRGPERKDLAKRIGKHLYDTVKLGAEVWWNAKTLVIDKLVIHDLLEWNDVSLAKVYREHDNRLPITLTVDSVEELMADREDDRRE
ncbi:MAG TPA: hypothetical protein VLV54_16775 [Thermoanaerobaculia bacterium]|nr:hypothetical protein [Thermoanaerobaculia bacterium]